MIRAKLSSVFVNDQAKALEFYTSKLGFQKKVDEPAGEYKWLTVGHPQDDFELLLESNAHPAAKTFQEAIFNNGIAATMFFVDDIDKEYEELKSKGVKFKSAPTPMGKATIAVFDDTCGNYITICQVNS